MDDLTREEFDSLAQIGKELLRAVEIPPAHFKKLSALGYVFQKTLEPKLTEAGIKGDDLTASLSRFEVSQEELAFWQSLSRCVAYAAFSNL
jgi:hypothetical protein